jgi:hypothetical protein
MSLFLDELIQNILKISVNVVDSIYIVKIPLSSEKKLKELMEKTKLMFL